MQGDTPMSNHPARLSWGALAPERARGAFRARPVRDGALVPEAPSRSPSGPAAGGTLARRTHPGNW